MKEYNELVEAGFSHFQALSILNAICSFVTPKTDIIDLLPFHSWLWYRLKQRRKAKMRATNENA